MNISNGLVSAYNDTAENKFERFLTLNGFKSILLSDKTYSKILCRNKLTLDGKFLLDTAGSVGVSLEELQEYMLSHTASVQTLMSLKGRELEHAEMESIQRDFILQKFLVVPDSAIQELKQTPQYIESKALEDKLNRKYDKLLNSNIRDIDPDDHLAAWFFVHVISFIVCGLIASYSLPTDNACALGMAIGAVLPMLAMLLVMAMINARPRQIRELRYRYVMETYGDIIDNFS